MTWVVMDIGDNPQRIGAGESYVEWMKKVSCRAPGRRYSGVFLSVFGLQTGAALARGSGSQPAGESNILKVFLIASIL